MSKVDTEYSCQAQNFINSALKLINAGAKESRIRENFTSYLRLMFPSTSKWVNLHIAQGETSVRLERNGCSISGFIDNCIDNIAIEYEKNLNIQSVFNEGYRQVREYCAAFANKGVNCEMITGILSDTLNWYVYEVSNNDISIGNFNQDNISLQIVDELHIKDASNASAFHLLSFLTKHLGKVGGRALSGQALAQDFGIDSEYTSKYIQEIVLFVETQITNNPSYYSIIEKLWYEFVDIESETEQTSARAEQLRHTYALEFYVSILAKLLAANLLSKKALYSTEAEIIKIISGDFFEDKGVYNFAEYDYFGWLSKDRIEKLVPTLCSIQSDLAVYDFSNVEIGDLFGSLLVQLANKHHRLLLGQELTPYWLSRKLVGEVINSLPQNEMPRFVDMCCGSGSMIVATIEATKEMTKDKSIDDVQANILSCCTGFDIDPLATILAKINWLVNVWDIVDFSHGVYIPIYHSDSLFLSSLAEAIGDSDESIVSLYNRTIIMPNFLLKQNNQQLFDAIVNKCHDLIDEKIDKSDFENYVSNMPTVEILDANDVSRTIDFAYNLYSTMYTLNAEGKNGLWAFVLKNSLRPSLIKANFNGIVSNTPWLALSKIADNPYKVSLKNLATKFNILPVGASAHHVEMATIFLLSSVSRYLNKSGIFGCILPHSVLNGTHQTKFRQGEFSNASNPIDLNFSKIWLLPDNVFKNKSIILFGSKIPFEQKDFIPGNIIDSTNTIPTVFRVQRSGELMVWTNDEIKIERKAFNYYSFAQGADIMPRSLFFFDNTPIGNDVRIKTIDKSSDYSYFLKDMKTAKDFSIPNCKIPKDILFPVLLSHALTQFNVCNLPLALLPIKKDSVGRWSKLDDAEIKFLPRPAQHVIKSIQDKYAAIKPGKDLFESALNMRNKLTNQRIKSDEYVVVYGAGGSRICAAYFPANKFHNIVIDQTIYYYTTPNLNEAIFITGLLNSNALAQANSSFQPEGEFGRRHIHTLPATSIPNFDNNNTLHNNFVKLTSQLIKELNSSILQDLTNPKFSTVAVRRSRIYNTLISLPLFEKFNNAAIRILEESPL